MPSKLDEQSSARDSISTLFQLYSQDVYRYAWYNLRNSAKAEDVVQEVFFRAFRSWGAFRNDANPKTWLLSITRNYLYDIYRKEKMEQKILQDSVPKEIEDKFSSVQETLVLENALSHMKDSHRQAIVLRYVQNLSVREVSQILGCSESKVRSTTHRALKKLRQLIDSKDREVIRREN